LLPLSAAEVLKGTTNFIPNLFKSTVIPERIIVKKHQLAFIIAKATYPEISMSDTLDPILWYDNYVNTVIKRDIRSMAQIDHFEQLPLMLFLLAHRIGNLLCHASLSREAGIATTTYKKHLAFFHHVFLINLVQPWYRNLSKRLVKSPKVFMVDTALLTHILNINDLDSHVMKGSILENFVASELQKQLLLHPGYKLFHFRTQDDKEVDFLIERNDGKIVGIEVKYSMTVSIHDFKGLNALEVLVGDDFKQGIVLYQGSEILQFRSNLYALPLECLWEGLLT
jgi:hypothetical protein